MSHIPKKHTHASILGGAMIIAGTAMGAGMLANPTATAGIWFSWSIAVFVYTWFCMLISGLMLLEANLHYHHGASFSTIVKDLLGQRWNVINGLSVAFVLYILIYAYITSGGGLTAQYLHQLFDLSLPASLSSLLFCLIFAVFVWYSTKAVDRMSVILIGGMVISFVLSMIDLTLNVKADILLNRFAPTEQHYLSYLWIALPACLVSFGYHGNVPSLVKYFQGDVRKIVQSLIFGTLLALAIYLLWQLAIQGNLPRSSFAPVIAADGDVAVLLNALAQYIQTEGIATLLNAFAYMAISSSFIGVALGLFDYLADLFKIDDSLKGRTLTAAITFLPPLCLSLIAPFGFVTAIGFAGLAATIWAAIVPALLVKASRKRFAQAKFQVFGGNVLIYFIILFGLLNIFAQIAAKLELIPIFTG